ncbi:MAG: hypothetical protein IT303_09050 [Dehalococcoidia bacterium]|nr:hypothetical protein [Dehalococcoidia bacterium]
MTRARIDAPGRQALARLAEDLDALNLAWAVVGGIAVQAHCGSGATDDIDAAVAVADDATAELVVRALQDRGYALVTSVEDEATGRLASVRLDVKGDEDRVQPVQLLFASSGIEPELAAAATRRPIAGTDVPVAAAGHLLALKVLAHDIGRPQDGEDIAALLRCVGEDALQQAEDAFVLITDRGFNRDRDLMADYERFLAREPATG